MLFEPKHKSIMWAGLAAVMLLLQGCENPQPTLRQSAESPANKTGTGADSPAEASSPLADPAAPFDAKAEYQGKMSKEVFGLLEKADRLDSNIKQAFFGRILQANQLNELALDAYTRHLATHPNDYETLYLKGVASEKLGDLQSAMDSWRQCCELKAGQFDASWRLALAYIDSGQFDDAQAILAEALSVSGDESQLWLLKAKASIESGALMEAKEILQENDFAGTNGAYATYLAQRCQFLMGESEQPPSPVMAEWEDRTLGGLQKFVVGVSAKRILAGKQFELREFEQCLSTVNDILKKDQSDFRDWNLKAKCHWELGQLKSALSAINQAIKRNDRFYELHMFAAELALKDDNEQQAGDKYETSIQHLNTAIDIDSARWEAYDALARISLLQGEPEAAIESLFAAVERLEKPNQSNLLLLNLLVEAGRTDEARTQISELPERYRNDGFIQILEARLAIRDKDPARVGELWEKLQKEYGEREFWKQPLSALKTEIDNFNSEKSSIE